MFVQETIQEKSPPLHTVIRIHLISLSNNILVFFAISFYFYGANVNVNVNLNISWRKVYPLIVKIHLSSY